MTGGEGKEKPTIEARGKGQNSRREGGSVGRRGKRRSRVRGMGSGARRNAHETTPESLSKVESREAKKSKRKVPP
jgi:hypothetical protein